ncbi:MAG: hypothetical protein EOP83_23290 [Verrucomicrobiaceae bacterium]|nr:MAG: hypothetical protein EOP83_23290 [Verrucomicrobiaceae bacterium]
MDIKDDDVMDVILPDGAVRPQAQVPAHAQAHAQGEVEVRPDGRRSIGGDVPVPVSRPVSPRPSGTVVARKSVSPA